MQAPALEAEGVSEVEQVAYDFKRLCLEASGLRNASLLLSRQYFGGKQILFSDAELLLDQTIDCLDQAVIELKAVQSALTTTAQGAGRMLRSHCEATGLTESPPEDPATELASEIADHIQDAARFEAVSLTDTFEKAMEVVRPMMKVDRLDRFRSALKDSSLLETHTS